MFTTHNNLKIPKTLNPKTGVDVVVLSETRLSKTGSLIESGEGYTFFWQRLPSEQPRIHGVGFAVHNSILNSIPIHLWG